MMILITVLISSGVTAALIHKHYTEHPIEIERIKEMEQKDFINISNRVIEISGVNAEKVQTEVENFRQDQ